MCSKPFRPCFAHFLTGMFLKSIKTRHGYFWIENTTWFFAVFPPCWCENRRLTHDPTMRRNCWQQHLFVWTAGPRSKCMQFTCQLNEKMKLPPTWLCLSSLCRCHETAMIPAMCMELSRITKVSHSSSMGVGLNPPIAPQHFSATASAPITQSSPAASSNPDFPEKSGRSSIETWTWSPRRGAAMVLQLHVR